MPPQQGPPWSRRPGNPAVVRTALPLLLALVLCFNPPCACSLEFRNLKALVQHAARIYKPHLTHRQIDRAMFTGDQHRLLGVLAKMFRGEPVKVVTVGGSITAGQGVYDGSPSYVQRLREWSGSAWPQGNVQVLNGAFPGVNSDYFSMCASAHVAPDANLVIVELCSNDPPINTGLFHTTRRSFERLIRKLLGGAHKPAVLLLNTFQPLNVLPEYQDFKYLINSEAFFFEVASYYGLPMMSMKAVAQHLADKGVAGYLMNTTQHELKPNPKHHPDLDKYLFWDLMHPSAASGHRLLFELIVHMLLKGSHTLLGAAAAGAVPAELVAEDSMPLPPPIFRGNFEPKRESCLIGEKFRQTAVEMNGFTWVNEAKSGAAKWGYTALTAGSFIRFRTSTMLSQAEGAGPPAGTELGKVAMLLSFLSSYEHQGIAEVTCSGCQCKPSRLDGHRPGTTTSQLSSHPFQVSQHPDCIVTVTVLQESTSGEHKVKLGALMLSDEVGTPVGDPGQGKLETIGGVMGAGGTFDPEIAWKPEGAKP